MPFILGGRRVGIKGFLWKKLGKGDGTFFWGDLWVGERCLKDLFPRLYRLSCHKESRVSEMGSWVEGVWKWDLQWSRVLSSRNIDLLENLLALIGRCSPSSAGDDL